MQLDLEKLFPFGVVINSKQKGVTLDSIPTDEITRLVDEHRVVVFRGFTPLEGEALPEFCRSLGTLLEWDFGFVNKLQTVADAQNYLYTNSEVPFHWDGAFAGRIPHYIFFHCDVAPDPDAGGETLFTDTTLLLEHAAPATRELWSNITITYSTEKIVHYGGEFTAPMISSLDDNGAKIVRFAEPVVDLNPVTLKIDGIDPAERAAFLFDMHRRLNDNRVCYRHQWQTGDIVIADNLVLLHGRSAFHADSPRAIRRVNIL